ncbi:MAG: threonylcarbamoyl-AMP synthase [Bacteroidales bacterium]|nr:threonylcarbamoyl-AMP synthase [Bacteroidales bacterium]
MLLKLYNENPNIRQVLRVVECLREGGVIIYPTDTVYGLGADIRNPKALERMARIKGVKVEKAHFSLICHDLSQISEYTRPIPNFVFKTMKRVLPGPYTFILNANSNVPRIFQGNKKTIGIRVPDNNIIRTIVRELGNPIASTSIHDDDEILEYTTDPELIHEKYEHLVDIVIDGGYGGNEPSTVLDCTGDEIVVIREGKGVIDF